MALAIITWLWGTKYGADDVRKLAVSVKEGLIEPHSFTVFTDQKLKGLPHWVQVKPIDDPALMSRHCFCRLRQFDPAWQVKNGFNDRIVSIDLDAVIIKGKHLDKLFDRNETFLILQGVNAVNPNPFNGSLSLLRVGKHKEVWSDFSWEKATAIPYHEFPDDQGWIWHKLPRAAGWVGGSSSGIYAFKKPGWPSDIGSNLPQDAKIVFFVGSKKPSQHIHLWWVRNNWALR